MLFYGRVQPYIPLFGTPEGHPTMKTKILMLALVCIALPAKADPPHLKVGQMISWPVGDVYDRDYVQCYDLKNAQEAYRIYVWSGHSAAAVEDFVQAHDLPANRRISDGGVAAFWSNVCGPLLTNHKYRVAKIFAGWDGIVCLEMTDGWNPGASPSPQSGPPEPPTCFWAVLGMPPTLSRSR